jgi:hypothetical protein
LIFEPSTGRMSKRDHTCDAQIRPRPRPSSSIRFTRIENETSTKAEKD